jgi:hypothetical protein
MTLAKTEPPLQPEYVNAAPQRVGDVLPSGGEQPQPLRLREAAPYPVRLLCRESVRRALGPNGTGSADRLGRDLTACA